MAADKTTQMKTQIAIDGEREYKAACDNIGKSLGLLGSEMRLVTAEYADNGKSAEALKAKQDVLKGTLGEQNKKVAEAEKMLKLAKQEMGENSDMAIKYETALNNAKTAVANTEKAIADIDNELGKSKINWEAVGDAAAKGAEIFAAGIAIVGTAAAGAATALAGLTVAGGQLADDLLTQSSITGLSTDQLQEYDYALRFIDGDLDTLTKSMTKNIKSMASAKDSTGELAVDTEKLEKAQTKAANAALAVESAQIKYDEAVKKGGAGSAAAQQAALNLQKAQNNLASAQNDVTAASEPVMPKMNAMAEAYNKLGVAVTDSNGELRNAEDVYWEAIDALGQISNDTERDAIAMQIFGKSAKELNPVIEAGSEAFKAMGQEAHELGAVMGEDALNKLGAFDDKMQQLDAGVNGLKNSASLIALPFLDVLAGDGVNIMKEFGSAVNEANGDVGKISDAFGEAFGDALNLLSERLPEFIDMGVTMLLSVVDGIVAAIPGLTDAAVQIVTSLVNAIVEMLPALLDGAAQLVLGLAEGIGAALPELVPKIVEVMLAIVQTLIDNIPMLIEAALQLIIGLAEGIIQAIPVIIEALPELITSLIDALLSSIPLIIQAGIDLLVALVEALPEIIQTIVEALPQIIQGIIFALLDNLPLIIQAGVDLITALITNLPLIITTIVMAIPEIIMAIVEGLLGNIPALVEGGVTLFTSLIGALPRIIAGVVMAIPEIVTSIVEAFTGKVEDIKNVGLHLIEGLWEGIKGAATWIKDKVTGFFGDVVGGIKDFLGIHSPSTVFADIGGNMAAGVGEGFGDEMGGVGGDMQDAIGGAGDLTALEAINAINDGIKANVDKLAEAVRAIVEQVLNGLIAENPKFTNHGTDIDKAIAGGMVEGVKNITDKIPQITTQIINAFTAQAAKFANIGLDIDKGIAGGMVNGIEQITAKIPQIVTSIINAFNDKAPEFNATGAKLTQSLGDGMAAGAGQITAQIQQMVYAVVDTIRSFYYDFVQAGQYCVQGIWDGFQNMSYWLESNVRNMMRQIVNAVQQEMQINSPSRVFAGIGEYMAAGLGLGFIREMGNVERDIRAAMPSAAAFEADAPSVGGRIARGEHAPGGAGVSVTQNFYTDPGDYLRQQREAAKNIGQIARAIA